MVDNTSKKQCPKCGSNSLLVQRLPEGKTELICLELECDFARVVPTNGFGAIETTRGGEDAFEARLVSLSDSQLRQMADNLANSEAKLAGRAKRTARRQLALVNAELDRRSGSRDATQDTKSSPKRRRGFGQSRVPPQFDTPKARARRLEGIKQYHKRRKDMFESASQEATPADLNAWLHTLIRTLRHEAEQHEEAAKEYSRSPELFPLHIDHSARAFELRRVLDLLTSCLEFPEATDEP